MSGLLWNETQVNSSASVDSLRWNDPPEADSLGASVVQTEAFRVSSREELAAVLDHARENGLLVRTIASGTSSKAFIAPPASFMEHMGKRGIALVQLSPTNKKGEKGEFGQIDVNMDRAEVTVGAGVSLREMDEAVRLGARVANGRDRERLMNLLKITTMDAGAVATAVGSGGVSDGGECGNTLMTGSEWMDGRGVVHRENYSPRPGEYFSPDTSSFGRVNHLQVGREMSGRGGPFGIGLEASFRLVEAPIGTHTVVWGFHDSADSSAREKLESYIVRMNQMSDRLKATQSPIQTLSLEVMDRRALNVAQEGMGGWSLPLNGGEPEFAVIGDFAQYDFFDEGHEQLSSTDALLKMYEEGFITDDEIDNVTAVEGANAQRLQDFRLQGPEHMRSLLKRAQREAKQANGPIVGSESTDWAVNPRDPDLVRWYLGNLFSLHDKILPNSQGSALYGHLFNRLDIHHRVIAPEDALKLHAARLTSFGLEVGERQKKGEWVRVRGEKVELPFGRDLKCIGMQRDGEHRDSNRRLLRRIDPSGLFKDRAPERWGGQFEWR